jgi:hypothetical protein
LGMFSNVVILQNIDKLHSTASFYFIRFCCSHLNVTLSLLHTAYRRVLLEKLAGSQPVKKFPAFHGIKRFVNTSTSACHLSLTWVCLTQSMP